MARLLILTQILLDVVAPHLREFFRVKWDQQYPATPWQDDIASLQRLLKVESKIARNLPKQGNSDLWDPTALFSVLLYSTSIGQRLTISNWTAIDNIRKWRNDLAHYSRTSSYMPDTEYRQKLYDIKSFLTTLGFNDAEKEIKDIEEDLHGVSQSDLDRILAHVAETYRLQLEVERERNQDDIDNALICIHDELERLRSTTTNMTNQGLFLKIQQWGYKIIMFAILVSILTIVCMLYLGNENIPSKEIYLLDQSKFYFPNHWKPDFFVGRETDVEQLTTLIRDKKQTLLKVIGPPAVGKTTLAISVGEDLSKKGSGVAFANVAGQKSMTTISHTLCLALHFSDNHPNPMKCTVDTFQSIESSQKIVIIIDDIDSILDANPTSFMEFIDMITYKGMFVVITTSRMDFHSENIAAEKITVLPLTEMVSARLLISIHPQLSEAHASKLATLMKGSPLLLELIGYNLKYLTQTEDVAKIISRLPEQHNLDTPKSFFPILDKIFANLCFAAYVKFLQEGSTEFYMSGDLEEMEEMLVKLRVLKISKTMNQNIDAAGVLAEYAEFSLKRHLNRWHQIKSVFLWVSLVFTATISYANILSFIPPDIHKHFLETELQFMLPAVYTACILFQTLYQKSCNFVNPVQSILFLQITYALYRSMKKEKTASESRKRVRRSLKFCYYHFCISSSVLVVFVYLWNTFRTLELLTYEHDEHDERNSLESTKTKASQYSKLHVFVILSCVIYIFMVIATVFLLPEVTIFCHKIVQLLIKRDFTELLNIILFPAAYTTFLGFVGILLNLDDVIFDIEPQNCLSLSNFIFLVVVAFLLLLLEIINIKMAISFVGLQFAEYVIFYFFEPEQLHPKLLISVNVYLYTAYVSIALSILMHCIVKMSENKVLLMVCKGVVYTSAFVTMTCVLFLSFYNFFGKILPDYFQYSDRPLKCM